MRNTFPGLACAAINTSCESAAAMRSLKCGIQWLYLLAGLQVQDI